MSRGLGELQQRVLSYLARHDGHAALPDIAAAVLDTPDRRPQLVSLRRALHALEARGRVRVLYVELADAARSVRGVGLHVWLKQGPPGPGVYDNLAAVPLTDEPRRWTRRSSVALDALRGLTQQDVEQWLSRARTAKGYGPRGARMWSPPPATPPWIPYQLAARAMAIAMGATVRDQPLSSNISRSIRRMIERAVRDGSIEVREERYSLSRKYAAVRVFTTAHSTA